MNRALMNAINRPRPPMRDAVGRRSGRCARGAYRCNAGAGQRLLRQVVASGGRHLLAPPAAIKLLRARYSACSRLMNLSCSLCAIATGGVSDLRDAAVDEELN